MKFRTKQHLIKVCFLAVMLAAAIAIVWRFGNGRQFKEFIALPASSSLRMTTQRSRLEFVSYTSSEWEQMWLENVDQWIRPYQPKRTCRLLEKDQAHFVHDFLNLTCTTRFPRPYEKWCRFEDYFEPMYYNTLNRGHFELSFTPPAGLLDFEQRQNPLIRPEPVVPTERDEHIVSKFVFRDTVTGEELVEYIEPLVSHLRFPLAGCLPEVPIVRTGVNERDGFVLTKSYIIPPAPAIRSSRRRTESGLTPNKYHDRYLYFDAGASSWSFGGGGPSLQYFTNMWQRHGIVFDEIYAFEGTTTAHEFYQSIPNLFWSDRTVYQQAYVSSYLKDDTPSSPFIPKFIEEHATVQDYVVFKLDIDSPGVEVANMDYLLQPGANDARSLIDELFWEHHIYDNPFMRKHWFGPNPKGLNETDNTIRGSYNYFLQLRKLGVRAHSWV